MRMRGIAGCLLCGLLLALGLGAVPAQAERELLTAYVEGKEELLKPDVLGGPPEGQIEGACGLTIAPDSDQLYVSDYYHHLVDIFAVSGEFRGKFEVPPLHGVCGLAYDAVGKNLYANEWHENVQRLRPSPLTFDTGESTGVAVDEAGNVYVNDRTHVAVYQPSGAPLLEKGVPLVIGTGSLGDAYGLAVFEGRVYVPDAADDTVKVFEPAGDPLKPVATIGGFTSLVDAAVTVDPTNGHLLVVDNRQPGYEHPEAEIYEFDSSGALLDTLPNCRLRQSGSCVPGSTLIDGEPSGIAVDPATGNLYVTTGNTEKSNAVEYGEYEEADSVTVQPPAQAPGSPPGGLASSVLGPPATQSAVRRPAASTSVIVQRRGVRVSFDGKLTPHALPRRGAAPVGIAVDARIAATGGGDPPQLRKIAIAINRHGHFSAQGLPVCRLRQIQPSTTGNALAACHGSLVGEGHFSANVKLPEQSPFPSEGKVLLFNGRLHGRQAIFAHIYGTQPAPTSNVLPFLIEGSHGTYGTILEASLPQATGNWGYVTGLRMTLRRQFSYRGKAHSYLSAGCPAPAGFPSAVFPLARTSFSFAGGLTLVSVLNRNCKATG